jgi:hypothetical protein
VAAIALVVTAAVAVAGWLVSQAQARRASRRNMRINYLLDAYRRLDRASNRQLDAQTSLELEAAISDVMLLGSPDQAELAANFAKAFAAEHIADAQPLLLALRNSLRRELLLGDLPPTSYVSLRVTPEGDTVSATAQIWREATDRTRRSVESSLAEIETAQDFQHEWPIQQALPELAPNVSPGQAVADSAQRVEQLLRKLLAEHGVANTSTLSMQQLASRALQSRLIDAQLADSINSLGWMYQLAKMDEDRLTGQRAAAFVSLSDVIASLIELAGKIAHNRAKRDSSWPGSDPGMAR